MLRLYAQGVGFSVWEGFARLARGRAHVSILSVAEETLRASAWTRKGYRESSPEEKSRITFHVAEILARMVADDYRRARELGLELHELGTAPGRFHRRSRRRRDRASVLVAVGNLADAEASLEEHREGFEAFEESGDDAYAHEHRWYREARADIERARARLKLDA